MCTYQIELPWPHRSLWRQKGTPREQAERPHAQRGAKHLAFMLTYEQERVHDDAMEGASIHLHIHISLPHGSPPRMAGTESTLRACLPYIHGICKALYIAEMDLVQITLQWEPRSPEGSVRIVISRTEAIESR